MADAVARIGVAHDEAVVGGDEAVVAAGALEFEQRVGEGALLLGGERGLVLADGHHMSPIGTRAAPWSSRTAARASESGSENVS